MNNDYDKSCTRTCLKKYPTNCDAYLAESLFQTGSRGTGKMSRNTVPQKNRRNYTNENCSNIRKRKSFPAFRKNRIF
ncbi:DUF6783 domain-containing protein [Blautia luti]|uniref:DUF6783 domain-containing protein n=1 Tax=Blautia luti TaxID=89014 RepID=UPI003A7F53E5